MIIRWGLVGLMLAGGLLATSPSEGLAQKRQRDVISRDEIMSSAQKDRDLFQVIRALRPHFLQAPKGIRTLGGSMGIAPLAVYVEGRRETGVESLNVLAAKDVQEVRYLDPARSENQFGIAANGGALVVKLHTNTAVSAKVSKPD